MSGAAKKEALRIFQDFPTKKAADRKPKRKPRGAIERSGPELLSCGKDA